jgi:16S rRNA (guanine(527)-N(7))-methyltransferase RsmG
VRRGTPAAPDADSGLADKAGPSRSPALDILAAGAVPILGRPLAQLEIALFDKYLQLLRKWQRVQRLVGSADESWIVRNLFLDSLLFIQVLPVDVAAIADLGSGAGFPGVPIKIVRPDLEVTLIESRDRRASFLSSVIRELRLARIRVIGARAEMAPAGLVPAGGAVVARCAGEVAETVRIGAKLAVPGAVVICSGPPRAEPLPAGKWVEIPGVAPGSTRRFAVIPVL